MPWGVQPHRLHAFRGSLYRAMALAVRNNLHFAKVGSGFVFLDLAVDRYFMLRGDPADRFDDFLEGVAGQSALDWLMNRQLIDDHGGSSLSLSRCGARPDSSLVDDGIQNSSACWVARALTAQLIVRRQIERLPLSQIFERLRRVQAPDVRADMRACRVAAGAFQRAKHYMSATDQCLVRGLAMKCMLGRRGCDVQLIIGVTMPFSAHCWVQCGSVVLTDPIDLVRRFEPLLVI